MPRSITKEELQYRLKKREELGKLLHLRKSKGQYLLLRSSRLTTEIRQECFRLLDLAVMQGIWEVRQPSDAKDFFNVFFDRRLSFNLNAFFDEIVDSYWKYINS